MIKELEKRIMELEDKIQKKYIFMIKKNGNSYIYVDNIYYKLWQSNPTCYFSGPPPNWTNENKLMIKDNNLIQIIEYLLNNNMGFFENQFIDESKARSTSKLLYEEVREYLKKNDKKLLERIKIHYPEISNI